VPCLNVAEGVHESFDVKRFGEKSGNAVLFRVPDVFKAGVAGEDDDIGEGVVLADGFEEVDAVHFRHPDVGDHDIEMSDMERLNGVEAVCGDPKGVLVFEQVRQRCHARNIIIDKQDVHRMLRGRETIGMNDARPDFNAIIAPPGVSIGGFPHLRDGQRIVFRFRALSAAWLFSCGVHIVMADVSGTGLFAPSGAAYGRRDAIGIPPDVVTLTEKVSYPRPPCRVCGKSCGARC